MGHIVFRTLQIKGVAAMSKTVAIRRDGVFGELYWALGLPSRCETMEMLKNLEIG